MKAEYLDRDFCRKRAHRLVTYNDWKRVSEEQIAMEIYGHAYVYYHWKWMKRLPLANHLIYSHVEDGIDVEDKPDRFRWAWERIWDLQTQIK